ncbi:MAG: preprotein translocase subunit YajC [Sporolactobacillus sp.]
MGQLIIPLVLFVAIFYFMLIRPQQKRTRETREMQSSLSKGDKIITIGGLHGTIESFDEKTMVLKSGNSRLTFDRAAIREKISKAQKTEEPKKVEEKSEKELPADSAEK